MASTNDPNETMPFIDPASVQPTTTAEFDSTLNTSDQPFESTATTNNEQPLPSAALTAETPLLPPITSSTHSCKCLKSKCLKLYCDCFRHNVLCSPACSCHSCNNLSQHDGPVGTRTLAMLAILRTRPKAFDGGLPINLERNEESVVAAYAEAKRSEEQKVKSEELPRSRGRPKLQQLANSEEPKRKIKPSRFTLPPLQPIPTPQFSIEEILAQSNTELYDPPQFTLQEYPMLAIDETKDYSSYVNEFKGALFKEPSMPLALAYTHRDYHVSRRAVLHDKKSTLVSQLDELRRQFASCKAELLNINNLLKLNSQAVGGWTHKVFELELIERPCGFNDKLGRLGEFVERYGVLPSHGVNRVDLIDKEKDEGIKNVEGGVKSVEGDGVKKDAVDGNVATEADGVNVDGANDAAKGATDQVNTIEEAETKPPEEGATGGATNMEGVETNAAAEGVINMEGVVAETAEGTADQDAATSRDETNEAPQPSKSYVDQVMQGLTQETKQADGEIVQLPAGEETKQDIIHPEIQTAEQPAEQPIDNTNNIQSTQEQIEQPNKENAQPHFTEEEAKSLATFISSMKLKVKKNKSLAKTQPHRIRALQQCGVNLFENEHTARFDVMFDKLLAYKKEMGTFRMPSLDLCKESGDEDLISLHNWIFSQIGSFRYQLKTKKVSDVKKFLDVGFSFEKWYGSNGHVFERDIPAFDSMARKYVENGGVAPPEYEEMLRGEGKFAGKKRKSLHGPRVRRYPKGPDRRLKKNRVLLQEDEKRDEKEKDKLNDEAATESAVEQNDAVVENDPVVMEEDLGGGDLNPESGGENQPVVTEEDLGGVGIDDGHADHTMTTANV